MTPAGRAARYTGRGAVEVVPVAAAVPGPGEVRIAVAYVGLCGTDLHILHGAMDARVTLPLTFGHEMSGRIESIGDGVVGWRPGDPVTVMPLVWDRTCPACRQGDEHICHHLDFLGIDSPGALQTLWTVPASTVVALPPTSDLRAAALVEPVAVAVHDVRRSELGEGDRVLVVGGGPIGLLIAVVARARGAEVVVVELDAARRAGVAALGFRVADPAGDGVAGAVESWTGGAGVDVAFEVSGSAAGLETAVAAARTRGTVVVVAIHPVPRPLDLHRVFWRELRLLGARVYRREDFDEAVRLLATGVVPVDAVVTATVGLEGVAVAVAELEAGRALKVLVDVGAGGEAP